MNILYSIAKHGNKPAGHGIMINVMANKHEVSRKLRVNIISESEFTVKAHGVHTAYVEMTEAYKKHADIDVEVNTDRQADIVHIHTVGSYALGKLLRKNGKKVVSAHIVPNSLIGSLVGAKYWRPFAKLWLWFFYNRADLVIAVSESTKSELEAIKIKRPIKVICNTIDTSPYLSAVSDGSVRAGLGISKDAFVIIGSGQTQPRKRIDTFIEMAKATPNIEYIWVGGMPFGKLASGHEKIVRSIKNAPVNVHFPGIVDLDEMPKWYKSADAFVLPSDQETFGLAVVEAAASGLPLILRDIKDYNSTFRDGALVASADTEFADIARKLSAKDDFYQMAVKKARVIAKRFDGRAGADALVNIYKQLLQGDIK